MLVSVSIRLYRCSGGGLLDLSTIPQQDHKHRHKHTLSAANANLPKCVCICVYLCLCVVCNDVHYNSSSVPAMAQKHGVDDGSWLAGGFVYGKKDFELNHAVSSFA